MNILVIGGSYFLGRVFALEAIKRGHTQTLLNRGTHPLRRPEIREIYGDRHDVTSFHILRGQEYDAVVDFCAYHKGDTEQAFQGL